MTNGLVLHRAYTLATTSSVYENPIGSPRAPMQNMNKLVIRLSFLQSLDLLPIFKQKLCIDKSNSYKFNIVSYIFVLELNEHELLARMPYIFHC
jgi:hypothetical protein